MISDLPARRERGASKTVLWRSLFAPGIEYCELSPLVHPGWRLLGDVVGVANGEPFHVHYVVGCDERWATFTARCSIDLPGGPQHRNLIRKPGKPWTLNAQEQPALDECVDVDLGFSPSTNTLPIRRLGLAVGESRELTAAWVRFPDFELLPLRQRYTRTGEQAYRYESVESGFTADLTVDDVGLVISYPGVWERVAEAGSTALPETT